MMKRRALLALASGLLILGPGAIVPPAAMAAPIRLTLEEAINRACASHPDLVSATARVRKAELTVEDFKNQRLGISAELNGRLLSSQGTFLSSLEKPLPATTSDPKQLADGTVGLTVPLFTGWKLTESWRAADLGEEAAKADRDDSRVALTLEVVKTFWGVRQAELSLDIRRQSLAQAERARDLAAGGKAAGSQSQHDVDQAQASVESAQADLLGQEGNLLTARIQLVSLLGMPGADLALQGDPPVAPGPIAQPEPDAIRAALARRPDTRGARARLVQAEARVAAARGDFWPQVAFSTSYQHGNNQLNQASGARGASDSWGGQWDALVSMKYNLFDLGKTSRGVERQEQDLVEARAALEKLERRVRSDIESTAVRASTAASRASFSDRAATLAQRHYEWVLARRQQGYGLALEVDDARGKLAIARSQLVGARIDYVIAVAELQAALGTL